MPRLDSIQWKALLLLVIFSTSFTVFCHCAAMAASAPATPSCCHACHKKAPKQADDQGCQGMQAVRFNLLEKQTAHQILPAPAPFTGSLTRPAMPVSITLIQTEKRKLPQQWSYKHSPPNRLSLYQCFLI